MLCHCKLLSIVEYISKYLLTSPANRQLRVIYSHLANEVKKKFGALYKKLVGGFCFLRFICPAVTSPDSFEFLSGTGLVLTDSSKRTCITLSKILQNVANGIQFKETYLQPLNEWLVKQNNAILDFVDHLTVTIEFLLSLFCA